MKFQGPARPEPSQPRRPSIPPPGGLEATRRCYRRSMACIKATFTLDEETAERARRLNIDVSAAARQGVADAVRSALARSDRDAYRRMLYVRVWCGVCVVWCG